MTTGPGEQPVVLALSGITKRFGALMANEGVDLELRRGEIVALLGENGAGKTTLMNILFGHYVADEGTVSVAGADGRLQPMEPGSPGAALRSGIGMVHQHFTLAENLTAFENIVLGTVPLIRPGLAGRNARARLAELMRRSGLEVDLDIRVSRLSVGEQQRVEILKALYRDARVLVLDEPTAVLTPQESDTLFATLKSLAAQGIAIVFISHKLAEVLAASDRVAVLRLGRKVADLPTAECDRQKLAELMVGHAVTPSRREPKAPGAALLTLDGVTAGEGRDSIRDVGFTLHEGEILGIAGVSGNGQATLARLLSGLLPAERGNLFLRDKPVHAHDAGDMIRSGIARIPEDRHRDGVVGAMTVAENLVIEEIRGRRYQRFGFLDFAAIAARAREAIAAYDIRCPGGGAVARLLSGGNIQKIVLARTLDAGPVVVLAAQPSRGLDIGATGDVHRRLLAARARGAGVILISEDLDELFALSDRIAVIHRGHLSAPRPSEELDRASVGLMMAGHHTESEAA
ncbi:ABC transporter ATP-binding protein [Stappia indica]|uniref:ABC transporter ATP-binding protein n=1 Tax=Stappia indica TaxID=538381 RepID=UPI001CD4B469|nr:ABC transporter ATP-binding protein [Stappia indica]MCA1299516.1 ABC transporter ATP-binding protein [Stappia indica]